MNTLKELLKNPSTLLVDVRGPLEYELEHLPGARNIPLEEIADNLDEFKSFENPVILYCRSGNRSGIAVNILKQHGISQVFNGGSIEDLQYLLN